MNGIPFMLLVDREGKVASIHTRGEFLGEKLAEMFGPVAADPADADPDPFAGVDVPLEVKS